MYVDESNFMFKNLALKTDQSFSGMQMLDWNVYIFV